MSDSTKAVAWGRVGLFYAIAFGIASATALVMARFGADLVAGRALIWFQLLAAFVYMPAPLIAGIVVERVVKRRSRMRDEFSAIRAGWLRIVAVSALAIVGLYAAELGLTYLLGNVFGIAGAGRLVFTSQGIADNIVSALPAGSIDSTGSMPPAALLYLVAPLSALMAGFTVNGLFAFGEEYGWRGVLADELAPLGAVRANLLTGVMWGVWHAPLIALGFNYGDARLLGVVFMCLWVTPLSFILWRAREYAGGAILPAAIIHGGFNAFAGFFLLFIAGRTALLSAPVGVIGAAAVTVVAIVIWLGFAPRTQIARRQAPLPDSRAAAISSNAR